jgi:hypothetical protein
MQNQNVEIKIMMLIVVLNENELVLLNALLNNINLRREFDRTFNQAQRCIHLLFDEIKTRPKVLPPQRLNTCKRNLQNLDRTILSRGVGPRNTAFWTLAITSATR